MIQSVANDNEQGGTFQYSAEENVNRAAASALPVARAAGQAVDLRLLYSGARGSLVSASTCGNGTTRGCLGREKRGVRRRANYAV